MPVKKTYKNPFWMSSDIPERFFCGRAEETDMLCNLVINHNNVVLKAERRVGKSALLHHLMKDRRIKDNFDVYYIDIFKTENVEQFAGVFASGLFKGNISRPFSEKLTDVIRMFRIDIRFEDNGMPVPGIGLSQPPSDPKHSVDALFDLLETSGRRALVIFDEFQQIKEYPDRRFDALLRTRIQRMNDVQFIFSGSERRLLEHMFNTSTEPFYRSCTELDLQKIDKEAYVDYAERMFRDFGKEADRSSLEDLYDLFDGYTSYLNAVLNRAFASTPAGGECDRSVIEQSVSSTITAMDNDFHALYFGFNPDCRRFLSELSIRHGFTHILSADFLESTGLTASRVQSVRDHLVGDGLKNRYVFREARTGKYSIDNKMFDVWLRNFVGQSISFQLSEASRYAMRDPKSGLRKCFPSLSAMTPEQKKEFQQKGYLSAPFETERIDMSKISYVVQRGVDGTPWALPVDDCLALLAGIEALPIRKGVFHPLTDDEKRTLSQGSILLLEGKRFQFDLRSLTVKRRYLKELSAHAGQHPWPS